MQTIPDTQSPVYQLAALCSRGTTHRDFARQLIHRCDGFHQWQQLIDLAHNQGVLPLVYHHLCESATRLSPAVQQAFRVQFLRYQMQAAIFTSELAGMLHSFQQAGLSAIVLKGLALGQTLYPSPAYRMVRDIDLLLSKAEGLRAHQLLRQAGFMPGHIHWEASHPHHLEPLCKCVDNVKIYVEIHWRLFRPHPHEKRKSDFAQFAHRAITLKVDGVGALTLNNEDMLWHIFTHGFYPTLARFEIYRLVSLADVITLVESRLDAIDWLFVNKRFPRLVRSLACLHYLTPWNTQVRDKLWGSLPSAPKDVGVLYQGPPVITLHACISNPWQAAKKTFMPAEWWCCLYYGLRSPKQVLVCRLWSHPWLFLRFSHVFAGRLIKKIYGLLQNKKL